jgi:hypothetical protein
MEAAQAAADALQRKLAMLETDLGAFWKSRGDGGDDSFSVGEGSGGSSLMGGPSGGKGSDGGAILTSSSFCSTVVRAGGGGGNGSDSLDGQSPLAHDGNARGAPVHWNNAYGLTDVFSDSSRSALGSPLKSLAKLVASGSGQEDGAQAAAAIRHGDRTEDGNGNWHVGSLPPSPLPPSSPKPPLSPLSALTPSEAQVITPRRRDHACSRSFGGSLSGGKENLGGAGFANPFSDEALDGYGTYADIDHGHGAAALATASASASDIRASTYGSGPNSWASDQTWRVLDDVQVGKQEQQQITAAFAFTAALAAAETEAERGNAEPALDDADAKVERGNVNPALDDADADAGADADVNDADNMRPATAVIALQLIHAGVDSDAAGIDHRQHHQQQAEEQRLRKQILQLHHRTETSRGGAGTGAEVGLGDDRSTRGNNTTTAAPSSPSVSSGAVAAAAARAAVLWEKNTLKHQLTGLKERFREALSEATATRDALDGYHDTVQRVEFQKRLLCAQVLELEAALADQEEEQDRLRERERVLEQREASMVHSRRNGGGGHGRSPPVFRRSPPLPLPPGATSPGRSALTDSWAGPPTPAFFLPKIIQLWREMRVPLLHRSQFLLAFRGRETFYFEAEHRRLSWLKSSLTSAGWNPEDESGSKEAGGLDGFLDAGGFGHGHAGHVGSRGGVRAAAPVERRSSFAEMLAGRGWGKKYGSAEGGGSAPTPAPRVDLARLPPMLRAAERMLTRERAALRRLARRLDKPQLEAIFTNWRIGLDSKRRKERLVNMLWTEGEGEGEGEGGHEEEGVGGREPGKHRGGTRRGKGESHGKGRKGRAGGVRGGGAGAQHDCFSRLRRHAELVTLNPEP